MHSLASPLLTLVVIAALALVAHAAQVTVNTPTGTWSAGSTVTITWAYDPSAQGVQSGIGATLTLMKVNGSPDNMTPITDIGIVQGPEGSFKWTVPTNLVAGTDYAVKFAWDGQPQDTFKYSGAFPISSSITAPISSSTTSSATTTSTSSSSSTTTTSSSTTTSSATKTTATTTSTTATATSSTSSPPALFTTTAGAQPKMAANAQAAVAAIAAVVAAAAF
ncbi:hypothetical protein AMAG_19478 [Allomyces macrogynus ATCC 38327]|uniref:Yeast cell wall synthesis Kre9/Knh1-like N-terminal domain-containing protein n=1 Tax=Allomyces macrogynus (strain ATCC 38327) TaxID=578462 RepID=A0A0L0SSN3_ALLM3|nr:hypothetical protein AMAG_19478 [Allomyces macrogynus ATCC 38327]|eukprot:KNE65501.1 hypothetical protein AMAG_19478 [Allomyces macrogynus ATCC 38327]